MKTYVFTQLFIFYIPGRPAVNPKKDICGYMVMCPSSLHHMVNPFYECDEERVSIAGNFGVMYE